MNKTFTKASIKQFATKIGFHLVGFTTPQVDDKIKKRYTKWISDGKHAGLWYLEDRTRMDLRFNPEKLMEGTKSIIVFGVYYRNDLYRRKISREQGYISTYALWRDYHRVIKEKLRKVIAFIKELEPALKARAFVDTAPVFERYFAFKAGLGFIGRNNFLINPKYGSFVFLGEIFTNIEFEPDKPINESCADCTLCIDTCPTSALSADSLDLNKCISYHTIENRDGIIPLDVAKSMGNKVFGCDECSVVCPYNKKNDEIPPFFNEDSFFALQGLHLKELLKISEEQFNSIFGNTPVKRIGYTGFLRNVIIAACNSASKELIILAKIRCKETRDVLLEQMCKLLHLLD